MRSTLLAVGLALAAGACGGDAEEPRGQNALGQPVVDIAQEAQRIRSGMTEAQVIDILGEPRNRVREPDGQRLTFWTFDGRDRVTARVYVSLDEEGKVVGVETIPL